MPQAYKVLAHEEPESAQQRFITDVRMGLSASPKRIPSLYFYDRRGSDIWSAITTLPEYYVTRTEESIIQENAVHLSALVGHDPTDIVELGCGCGGKTWATLNRMVNDGRDITYRPIDISEGAMENMAQQIEAIYKGAVPMSGVVADYVDGLAYVNRAEKKNGRKKLILFFGSNIGNLTPEEEREFLLKLRASMDYNDRLVIGFDLVKDLKTLQSAYDDPRGITREFNLNLLTRMNRELGANFDVDAFIHHPFYDPALQAMVSWLVSKRRQSVTFTQIDNGWSVPFREGEGIRFEMSRKYTREGIDELAARTCFAPLMSFMDPREFFIDSVWKPD